MKFRYVIYLLLLFSPLIWYLISIGEIAIVGGILLILASFFVYTGQIFYSIFIYFLADLAWIVLAFQNENVVGSILIFIGMTMGFLAWLKMNSGHMRKTLNW